MDIFVYALIVAAVLCIQESRNCSKRQAMWIEMGRLHERIEALEKRRIYDHT